MKRCRYLAADSACRSEHQRRTFRSHHTLPSLPMSAGCSPRAQNKIDELSGEAIYICMTKHAPGWDLYRSLLAVLRTGSLSAAARSIGLTQPTVGRHVDALEQALGV